MDITNEAKEYIQSVLEEQQAKGLRVYAIEGCCGLQIALSLDPPEESDTESWSTISKLLFPHWL